MELSKVLVVDDDASVIKAIRRMLRPVVVVGTTSGTDAITVARRESPELAIVDVYLRGESGLDVVTALHAEFPALVIGVISGLMGLDLAHESLVRSATWILEKPFDKKKLRALITASSKPLTMPPDEDEELSLMLARWAHLQRVLKQSNGNKSEAARRLQISRQSLQRMLRRGRARNVGVV